MNSADLHPTELPNRWRKRQGQAGFSWTRILIVLVIIVLAALALPNFFTARLTMSKNACFENLNAIAAAKEEYAARHKLQPGDTIHLTNLGSSSFLKIIPTCPVDGQYQALMKVGEPPACSLEMHNYQAWTNYNAEQKRASQGGRFKWPFR